MIDRLNSRLNLHNDISCLLDVKVYRVLCEGVLYQMPKDD